MKRSKTNAGQRRRRPQAKRRGTANRRAKLTPTPQQEFLAAPSLAIPEIGPAVPEGGQELGSLQKRISVATRFFDAVWGTKDRGLILVWHLLNKISRWLSDTAAAAALAIELERDVYMGVGLSPRDFGSNQRCVAEEICGVAGLWADIDIAGPAHKKLNLPPSEEAALELIAATGLRPTLVVHSGHGLQVWWLFAEVLEFENDDDRQRFADLAAGCQAYLRELARQRGWTVDSVGDLARVLRVPGTINCKIPGEPVPVRLLVSDGPRYADLAEFEERVAPLLKSSSTPSSASVAVGEIVLRADAEPSPALINALCANVPQFPGLWQHRRTDLPSQSEYDLALANVLVRAGVTDQVIADALIAHRRRWAPDTIEKALRIDYVLRTINTARSGSRADSPSDRSAGAGPTPAADAAGTDNTTSGEATESPVRAPQAAFEPFPTDALPPAVREYVVATAEAIGCDPAMVALPNLTMCGAAIGNSRTVRLKIGWEELPIVWAVVVAFSGTLKSPALDGATRSVRAAQARAIKAYRQEMEEYESALEDWMKEKKESRGPKPKPPVCVRYMVRDPTLESLALLLQDQNPPRGLILIRDELAAWFGGFDRYKQGRSDAPSWLEMHRGGGVLIDRKTGEHRIIHVPRASVAVTGGIQPPALRRALGAEYFENGLAARLLLAMPPKRPRRWSEATVPEDLRAEMDRVHAFLLGLEMGEDQDQQPVPIAVDLDPEAKSLFVKFYEEHAAEQLELSGHLVAAWSKLEAYAARLALIHHLVTLAARYELPADQNAPPRPITAESMDAAIRLTRWFANEAERVYAVLAPPDDETLRAELVDYIRSRGGSITVRDLARGPKRFRGIEGLAEAALKDLVNACLGVLEDVPAGPRGGRPTKRFRLLEKTPCDETSGAKL